MLNGLWRDISYGLRTLGKNPGFTAIAVLTLALGIGANTAIFSVLDAVLVKSLPYSESSRIALVWGVERSTDDRQQVSATDVMDWRSQNTVFEDIATYDNWAPTLTNHGEARRIPSMLVGDGYFNIMRAKPLLGRTFIPEENIDGKDNEVILSYGFWESDFAGDPSVIGKTLLLNGKEHTIVGVLPASFASLPMSLLMGPAAQIYRPVGENYDLKSRTSRHLRAIARLKPDVTLAQAQADMTLIANRISQKYPADDSDYGARVVPMKEDLVGGLRPTLLTLLGAVGFVLLIACANVANLVLARAGKRQREVAVRAALGASRGRLLRQVLTESVLLSLLGGGSGVLLAIWVTNWIGPLGEKAFPMLNGVELNLPVLLATLAVALLTGIVFGIIPAIRVARQDVNGALKEGSRSVGSESHRRLRNLLAVSEIALALVLVAGAALMIGSVVRLYDLNPGFAPDHLLSMDIGLPGTKYPTPASRATFVRSLLQKANALAGVDNAATTSVLPLSGNFDGRAIVIYDKPRPTGKLFSVDYYAVTPSYFQTMKIPLRAGRYFTDEDRAENARVVIVSETMANTIWANENPIGKRMRAPGQGPVENEPWSTVIGVVDDVKQWALDRPGTVQLYGDEWQVQYGYLTLVVRTKADPAGFAAPVRNILRALDVDLASSNVTTMDAIISDSIALRRLAMALLAAFGGLALVLACVGIYGVISYSVAQRTNEIGVRVALGAQRGQMFRLVIGEGFRIAVTGMLLGLGLAVALTRLLSSLLFGVGPNDPFTFASVAALLLFVAVAACYVPARRATKVDPMVALRYE